MKRFLILAFLLNGLIAISQTTNRKINEFVRITQADSMMLVPVGDRNTGVMSAIDKRKFIDSFDINRIKAKLFPVNYNDLTHLPNIPAQVNLIPGSNITVTGTYPNLTIASSGGGGGGGAMWGYIIGGDPYEQNDLAAILNSKQDSITRSDSTKYYRGDKVMKTLNKSAVGLNNVDNTSDINKPLSNDAVFALSQKQDQLVSGVNIKKLSGNVDLIGSGTQSAVTSLTTTGTTGAATFNTSSGVLNIPQYNLSGGGSGGAAALDQVLALGNTTDTTIVFNKATSYDFITVQPLQAAVAEHLNLTFGRYSFSNPGSATNNEVFNFGFNVNGAEAGHPGLWESWESAYYPGASRYLEKHEIYRSEAGVDYRIESYTMQSGNIDFYHTVDQFSLLSPTGNAQYFKIQPGVSYMQLSDGSKVSTYLDAANYVIYDESTSAKGIIYKGFTKANYEIPLYVIGRGATNANLTVTSYAANALGNTATLTLSPNNVSEATIKAVRGTGTYDVSLNFSTYLTGHGPKENRFVISPNGEAFFTNNVGIATGGTVNASALLELGTTSLGFLLPRMNTTQMNAISSPATGLMIRNTDAVTEYSYSGSAWKSTGVISGSYSQSSTAQTVFTVTFGGTQPNSTYKVNITPTTALSAALFYVTNKTTTTFDVTYLAGLTGTVTFDYSLYQ